MATVEEFLALNPSLKEAPDGNHEDVVPVKISVEVLRAYDNVIEFRHLGSIFVVRQDSIVDISEEQNSTSDDTDAKRHLLTVNSNTNLICQTTVQANALAALVPFSLNRQIENFGTLAPSPNEGAWRAAVGFRGRPEEVYGGVTVTMCGWKLDELKGD